MEQEKVLVGRAHRDRGKGGVGALHGDHTHGLTEVCVHKKQFSGSSRSTMPEIYKPTHLE